MILGSIVDLKSAEYVALENTKVIMNLSVSSNTMDAGHGRKLEASKKLPGNLLLEVCSLSVQMATSSGDIHAVRNFSLRMRSGERVAILGESGCGKTMTALALLGLLPTSARIAGTMRFEGEQVDIGNPEQIDNLVRRRSGIVFQDSLSSLNPISSIGTQLEEVLLLRGHTRHAAYKEAVRMLSRVGLPDPEARMKSYPHELSGGMRQRVMISMALLAKPALLIADEPTTALDLTVQAQVIDLIRSVQSETAMGLLLITHDLAMAAELCERAIVMYAGYVVEDVPMSTLLYGPAHPYTKALLAAMPRLSSPRHVRLKTIDGELPSTRGELNYCPFSSRCAFQDDQCMLELPPIQELGLMHSLRCVHPCLEPSTRVAVTT